VASWPASGKKLKLFDNAQSRRNSNEHGRSSKERSLSKEVLVASHKYKVGQNVRLTPTRRSSLMRSQECKIVRQLPIEGGSHLYRIKCVGENVERVAKEGDIMSLSLDQ
jgi:hypothetical protein